MTKINSNSLLIAKKAAGEAAAELIESGMMVGLGTGSTVAFFIEALGKRCQAGLKIAAIASSQQTARQAQRVEIPLIDSAKTFSLDLTVDGADEIDHHNNMIKGGGGALLREKLLAQASKEMVVIIDETKLINHLGRHPIPVEIASFVYLTTIQRIEAKGYQGILRLNEDQSPFITDNGNYIFDIHFKEPIKEPAAEHERLKSITGVLETGLFFDIAGRVIIGYENGLAKVQT